MFYIVSAVKYSLLVINKEKTDQKNGTQPRFGKVLNHVSLHVLNHVWVHVHRHVSVLIKDVVWY